MTSPAPRKNHHLAALRLRGRRSGNRPFGDLGQRPEFAGVARVAGGKVEEIGGDVPQFHIQKIVVGEKVVVAHGATLRRFAGAGDSQTRRVL